MRIDLRALLMIVCSLFFFDSVSAEVVASRTLRVGIIVQADDVRVVGESSSGIPSGIVGRETRKAIYAGRTVRAEDLGPVTVVRRNDNVTLVYRSGQLAIRTEGRALGAGGVGDEVTIMNLDTRISVKAMITGPKRVEVSR
ncbi:MAG: flagellar basal body P-ring formation chaperone FlgA [Pseudomonadota bacterium]